MSFPATLPKNELPGLASGPESGLSQFDLLNHLLAEQKNMTAVEHFSQWQGSAPSASTAYQSLLPTSAPQSGQQYAFEVDLDACSGC